MEKSCPYMKRAGLVKQVHDLTHLSVHAGENYKKIADFQRIVSGFADKLRDLYSQAPSDRDKLRLFEYGLCSKGCFEARLDTLMSYDIDSHDIYGQLKFEIMDRNKQLGKPQYEQISLDELKAHLVEIDFFKKNRIDPDSFKDLRAVTELVDKGFIKSPKEPSVSSKIDEALAVYQGFGSGREAFKQYLLEKTTFTQKEKDTIDQSITKFIEDNPDKAKWI